MHGNWQGAPFSDFLRKILDNGAPCRAQA